MVAAGFAGQPSETLEWWPDEPSLVLIQTMDV
jgi:hypothetical protein